MTRNTPCMVGDRRGQLGVPQGQGSPCRAPLAVGWRGPGPSPSPHQRRALAPRAAFWVLEPRPSVPASSGQLSLPCWSFCLTPATPQRPPSPRPDEAPAAATPPPVPPAWLPSLGEGQAHPRHPPRGLHSLPLCTGSPTPRCGQGKCQGRMPAHPSAQGASRAGPPGAGPLPRRPRPHRLSCLGRACPARAQEGPARWGHHRGHLQYSTLAGHGSDLWGSGGSSVFFIPGVPRTAETPGPRRAHSRQSLPQLQ